MNARTQAEKAETLRALHHGPELLVLPNVWDPLGARLVASSGFPAVATASAAVAFSLGHDDGQRIPFGTMLDVIRRIARAVDVPVTADIEAGFAATPAVLGENVLRVIEAGAVGVNLEDTADHATGTLFPREEACRRIRATRAAADAAGVPLVINARADTFLAPEGGTRAERLAEAVRRGRAYAEAGADAFYPITADDPAELAVLVRNVPLPINVYADRATPRLRELAALGVRRVSVGPGLLRAAVTAMRDALADLAEDRGYARLTTDAVSSDDIRDILRR